MGKGTERLIVGTILFLAALLRFVDINGRSVWLDEAFSWAVVTQSGWSEMISTTASDTHPPFYYFVLRSWVELFGDSLTSMRGLSAIAGLLSLLVLYLLVCEVFTSDPKAEDNGRQIGLIAICLMGVSSTHIRWCQETRMYSLATFLVIFSSWQLLRVIKNPTQHSSWTLYTISALALLYCHHYGLFSIFAQACFLIGFVTFSWLRCHFRKGQSPPESTTDPRPTDKHLRVISAVVLGAIATGYSFWIPTLLEQTKRVQADFWIPPLGVWSVPDAWLELLFPMNQPPSSFNHVHSLIVANVVVVIWILFLVRCRSVGEILILTMGTIPVVCAVTVSTTTVSVIDARHFLYVLPFLFAGIAKLVVACCVRRIRPIVIGLLITNLLAYHIYFDLQLGASERPGLRGVIQSVQEQQQDHDAIIVAHPAMLYAVRYTTRNMWDELKLLQLERVQHYVGSAIIKEDDVISIKQLNQLEVSRIWVIDTSGFNKAYQGDQSRLFARNWQEVSHIAYPEVYFFQGSVSATLYRRKD